MHLCKLNLCIVIKTDGDLSKSGTNVYSFKIALQNNKREKAEKLTCAVIVGEWNVDAWSALGQSSVKHRCDGL